MLNVNVNVKLSLRAISLIKKGLWAISPGPGEIAHKPGYFTWLRRKHIACDDYAFRIICTQRQTNTCKNSHEHADNLKSFFGCQTN